MRAGLRSAARQTSRHGISPRKSIQRKNGKRRAGPKTVDRQTQESQAVEAFTVGPGDVTLLLNDPLHTCSGCAKEGMERVLALFFYRLVPEHRASNVLGPASAAMVESELSERESRGMAAAFRRGFSFEQSRELFSGTNWRNITNYFVARRQRKHINPALVRPGLDLMKRVDGAVDQMVRSMTHHKLGVADFVLVEAFCNYYVRFNLARD